MFDPSKIPDYKNFKYWDELIAKSLEYDINPLYLTALVFVESSGNPLATKYEEDYKYIYNSDDLAKVWHCSPEKALILQKTSFGLGQVMGAVAIEHGLLNYFPFKSPTILGIPEIGLDFACKHYNKFAKKYENVIDIYAAYNGGAARKNQEGIYNNAIQVTRFIKQLNKLKTYF